MAACLGTPTSHLRPGLNSSPSWGRHPRLALPGTQCPSSRFPLSPTASTHTAFHSSNSVLHGSPCGEVAEVIKITIMGAFKSTVLPVLGILVSLTPFQNGHMQVLKDSGGLIFIPLRESFQFPAPPTWPSNRAQSWRPRAPAGAAGRVAATRYPAASCRQGSQTFTKHTGLRAENLPSTPNHVYLVTWGQGDANAHFTDKETEVPAQSPSGTKGLGASTYPIILARDFTRKPQGWALQRPPAGG